MSVGGAMIQRNFHKEISSWYFWRSRHLKANGAVRIVGRFVFIFLFFYSIFEKVFLANRETRFFSLLSTSFAPSSEVSHRCF